VSARAKTIWQTTRTHAARNLERDILLIANRLRVAVFTDGLPAVENRLSLFQGVAEKPLVEAHEQTSAPPVALKERARGAIECWDN